jgi:hypothetical protein
MLKIDPEFKALIPPLSKEEYSLLESNILRDGCRDPLTVWGETLLDGHNRHEICTKHGLPFSTFEIQLPDREAAMDWMDANQLGRRNLTREAHDLLLGRRYNRTKKAHGGQLPTQGIDQNDPSLSTAAKLAVEHGVSEATVKRAGQFAEAVEAQGLESDAMSGKLKGKKAEIVKAHRIATGKTKDESCNDDEQAPTVDDARGASMAQSARRPPIKIVESEGMRIWLLAKSHLDRINKNDEFREDALRACIEYCETRISAKK